jgi:hypothetical protein
LLPQHLPGSAVKAVTNYQIILFQLGAYMQDRFNTGGLHNFTDGHRQDKSLLPEGCTVQVLKTLVTPAR